MPFAVRCLYINQWNKPKVYDSLNEQFCNSISSTTKNRKKNNFIEITFLVKCDVVCVMMTHENSIHIPITLKIPILQIVYFKRAATKLSGNRRDIYDDTHTLEAGAGLFDHLIFFRPVSTCDQLA